MPNRVDDICREARVEELRPLPKRAEELLSDLDAPARLVAHLILVHDVAAQLMDGLPNIVELRANADAVRFGAATHDIGKALHPDELAGPGSAHEAAGESHLLLKGVVPPLAKFARTHGLDPEDPCLELDDLLVIAADKLWKGKRVPRLEERLIKQLASDAGDDTWSIWEPVNTLFDALSERADRRLEWQSRHPVD